MKETPKPEPKYIQKLSNNKDGISNHYNKGEFQKEKKKRKKGRKKTMMEQLFSHLEKDKTRSLQQIIHTNPKRSEVKK